MSIRRLTILLASMTVACNGVGFHEEENVVFSRFRTASVAPFAVSTSHPDAAPVPTESVNRFIEEVERLSDFEEVRADPEAADLSIQVDVSRLSIEAYDQNCCSTVGAVLETFIDGDCQPEGSSKVEVDMTAFDGDAMVYSLSSAMGSSDFECASDRNLREAYIEALDEALDEVAVFFLIGFDI